MTLKYCQDYLQNSLPSLEGSNAELEFVVGVGWADGNEMMKSVIRTGGQIKVWSTGITPGFERPTLSILIPLREDDPVSKTMLHKENLLNKGLHDVETSNDYKSLFPDSHTFAKLSLLTLIREKEDGTFLFNDLYELVKGELHYLEEEKSRR